jgi:cholesterol oxidase
MTHEYDVVVVGSGYGGGVAASRLAETGKRVCVLERGREILPGAYPETGLEALLKFQLNVGRVRLGRSTGLFEVHVGQIMSVLVGCGLGGTSLINANVALRPEASVFANNHWPTALRSLTTSGLLPYYAKAETMLGSNPYPGQLAKLNAFSSSAAHIGEVVCTPDINVTFADSQSPAGVDQAACTRCGNCVSGCNVGAKNTTLMNYLPYAQKLGAEIFEKVEVRTVSKAAGGKWTVDYRVRSHAWLPPRSGSVKADVVVLAAGTLGSTAILLRSERAGLRLSALLGEHFSGNGDALGYEYKANVPVHGMGWSKKQRADQARGSTNVPDIGPCITGMIDLRASRPPSQRQPGGQRGIVVQEGAMPGALRLLLSLPMAVAGARSEYRAKHRLGREPLGPIAGARTLATGLRHWALDRTGSALNHSESYLIIGHDDDEGVIVLDGDVARVDWHGSGRRKVIRRNDSLLQELTEGVGATFLEDPLSTRFLHNRLITVHPIGGCVMADDRTQGVVDDRGRVFDPDDADPRATHQGLYVADGSIVPRPLAANPSLTITALAERICALLIKDRGW